MNVLVISPRFPWPSYSGDRMRASIWLEALAGHRVALVAPPGQLPATASAVRHFAARPSVLSAVRGTLTMLHARLPLQSLLAARYAWNDAVDEAERAFGTFDAAIIILSRTDPWIRASHDGRLRILDSIDSLRRNAQERLAAAPPSQRWIWRHEERRLARVERDLARHYDHVVVVSEDETGEFAGDAIAIANSVPIEPLDEQAGRKYDFGFWGRLPYFANADAARWLLDEIVPAIRALHADARIVIGGADAPASLRRAARRAGIEVQSPIEDMAAFAREVRVAILPMRYGSGQSSKLLEAAEAGCGVITTAQAVRGLPHIAPLVSIAADSGSIAHAAVMLLHDSPQRLRMAARLRDAVRTHHSRDRVLADMAALVDGTRARSQHEAPHEEALSPA
jgi:glycosyltransferase involved in cell wall biosynthesis